MRRLVASGLLPERAGQPVKALVHISLADLIQLDGSSALMQEWAARVRARWAAHRAAASVGGSDGGAWLDGEAARGVACDASLTPVVTGEVNPAALEDMVRLCVRLDKLRHHRRPARGDGGAAGPRRRRAGTGRAPARAPPVPGEALEQAIIGKAVELLSGPGGLAVVPAPPAARRPAGRPQPAAGRRGDQRHPGRDPPRGHPAGPALPVPRRLRPARGRAARCTT